MPNHVVATDVLEPEGPVCLDDGQVYLVEMAKARACVSRIDLKGQRHEVGRPGGRPNGLTIDGDGNLWIAGGDKETVVCMAPDGKILKRFLGPDGDPYLWPNDLAFGRTGLLYLADSGILPGDFVDGQKIRDDFRTVSYHGRVFEIDPKNGKVLRTVDTGLRFTNGIAFDADDVLYVSETLSGNVYRYDVFGQGTPKRETFGNVIDGKPEAFVGPDGMAFGADGRLYCTVFGQGNVTVLDCTGKVAERIETNGQRPTNIAFREGAEGAVVTDLGRCELEEIVVPCRGRALYTPTIA
jgi:gluconolactonase